MSPRIGSFYWNIHLHEVSWWHNMIQNSRKETGSSFQDHCLWQFRFGQAHSALDFAVLWQRSVCVILFLYLSITNDNVSTNIFLSSQVVCDVKLTSNWCKTWFIVKKSIIVTSEAALHEWQIYWEHNHSSSLFIITLIIVWSLQSWPVASLLQLEVTFP